MMETYYGYVRTPADAIKLFEACRLGQLPRVQRRLSEKERGSIRSGSVFVWDEREAGMRRWTDGKSWSASRVSGSFLTYREMEGKRGNGFSNRKRGNSKTPDSGRGSDEDRDRDDGEPDGYRYKADGLMKQSFSITTSSGQHLHLISYYARGQQDLPQPSTDPSLRLIVPVKGMYPESSLHDTPVPAMTRSPMQQPFSHVHPQVAAPGLPPHHYAQYPPAGHQPGYNHGWPPSPVATPPYSHPPYTSAPSYSQPTLPLPLPHPAPHSTYGHQLPLQHQPYPPSAPASSMYERTPLPPPQSSALMQPRNTMSLPQPYPPSTVSPRPTISHTSPLPHHASPLGSPRTQHLQAQAMEAGLIDPELGINGHRGGHLALPPMSQPGQNGTIVTASPPTRTLSPPSPPRSSHSEAAANGISAPLAGGSNKVSLSSIINHPTPANPEPGSANARGGNSAHSSPRAPAGPQANGTTNISTGPTDADRQAIGALNKNFCV